MIVSRFCHQTAPIEKAAYGLLKHVSQRSLAVVMFIVVTLLASVSRKSSDKIKPNPSGQHSSSDEQYLSLNPGQLFGNITWAVEKAFNDPALVQYGNEQGVDGLDSLTPTEARKQGSCSANK
jgi:hypothetical protein